MKIKKPALFDLDPLIRQYIHQAGIQGDNGTYGRSLCRIRQTRSRIDLLAIKHVEDEPEDK